MPPSQTSSRIHPTALIGEEARLADDVTVGPYAIIEGPAVVGPGTRIAAHACLAGRVVIGTACTIGYGAVIGADPQDVSFDPSIDTGVNIGDHNTIREYVTIHRATMPGGMTTLGHRNFIMVGAHLGHDVTIGDHNFIANNTLLAGHITVGNRAFLSGGAVFHQFLRIGDLAMVQGKAGIGKDVPPFCVAHGINRLGGLNTVGLRRAGIGSEDRREIKNAYCLLFRSGKALCEALREAETRQWGDHASRLIEAVRHPTRRGVLSRLD